MFPRTRLFLAWAWGTARDVWREARHTWQRQGHLSKPGDWQDLADAEGLCRRAVIGRYELLVRAPYREPETGSSAVVLFWFFQVQDLYSHAPIYVSSQEWPDEATARSCAVDWALRGGAAGEVWAVKPDADTPLSGGT